MDNVNNVIIVAFVNVTGLQTPQAHMSSSCAYSPCRAMPGMERIATFVGHELEEDIMSVPGVQHEAAGKMRDAGVKTSYHLLAQLMTLRPPANTSRAPSRDMCNAMYLWLRSIGIHSHRNVIVKALAEKACVYWPGFYDESEI